ncbi:Piso0_005846 [Millerozyma farinosa CBS 7064]|uniref:Piso0_005846 protein n=1 Tax=Pichia sorbitophila (strain ATCC MYA-4447 / BCRC 22081 / CBS 7064 / NBRC 10061 / NRRL Y-12695) TaxID=559304 RepID=G8Y329_PICSO|nr:Piso0_005846 [Millerozyma farinosa CBS 7064]
MHQTAGKIDDTYRRKTQSISSKRMLRTYYGSFPPATLEQKSTDMALKSFGRAISKTGFISREIDFRRGKPQDLLFLTNHIDSLMFKVHLKNALIAQTIDFDSYCSGSHGSIDITAMQLKFGLDGSSDVWIHESDFVDFKSLLLQEYFEQSKNLQPDASIGYSGLIPTQTEIKDFDDHFQKNVLPLIEDCTPQTHLAKNFDPLMEHGLRTEKNP